MRAQSRESGAPEPSGCCAGEGCEAKLFQGTGPLSPERVTCLALQNFFVLTETSGGRVGREETDQYHEKKELKLEGFGNKEPTLPMS